MNNSSVNIPSRSDLVRQRLQQRSQDRVQKSRQSATASHARSTSPITTRGVVSGLNYRQPVQQKVRRQYYYSVGASGAEIKVPAIPDIRLGWRLLSAIIAIACLLGLYFVFNSAELTVNGLQTEGLQRLTAADLEAVTEVSGKSIVFMNPDAIRSEIVEAFPELSQVAVSISLPNEIHVSAVERQPVLIWQTEKQTYWLDEEGILIPPRGEAGSLLTIQAKALPPIVKSADAAEETTTEEELVSKLETALTGTTVPTPAQLHSWGEQVDPKLIDAAYELSLQIPAGTAILYDTENGMGWKSQQGWDVFIGLTLNDITYKLKAYHALIEKLSEEGITPSLVSVEYLHAPFYRE